MIPLPFGILRRFMPTYTYVCEYCEVGGYQFEEVKKVDDRHMGRCPKCGKTCKLIISPISGHYYRKPSPLFFANGQYEEF